MLIIGLKSDRGCHSVHFAVVVVVNEASRKPPGCYRMECAVRRLAYAMLCYVPGRESGASQYCNASNLSGYSKVRHFKANRSSVALIVWLVNNFSTFLSILDL